VWQPLLSPSAELVAQANAAEDEKAWEAFRRTFKAEMNHPAPSQLLDHQTFILLKSVKSKTKQVSDNTIKPDRSQIIVFMVNAKKTAATNTTHTIKIYNPDWTPNSNNLPLEFCPSDENNIG
jgi:hypothetical protein